MVLVSPLADQLSGQYLIFLVSQKKCPNSFFAHSLDIFCLHIREWPIFKKDWTKNSREWTKICPVSETGQFFWPTQKMRNWPDNWSDKETDQNHTAVPEDFCVSWVIRVFPLTWILRNTIFLGTKMSIRGGIAVKGVNIQTNSDHCV